MTYRQLLALASLPFIFAAAFFMTACTTGKGKVLPATFHATNVRPLHVDPITLGTLWVDVEACLGGVPNALPSQGPWDYVLMQADSMSIVYFNHDGELFKRVQLDGRWQRFSRGRDILFIRSGLDPIYFREVLAHELIHYRTMMPHPVVNPFMKACERAYERRRTIREHQRG